MKSLANRRDIAEIRQRLRQVRPDSPRRWGRMTAHQMICHACDAFLMGTAARPVSSVTGFHHRTIVKWMALYGPVRWPQGIRTRPEIDQLIGGTRPTEFQMDVEALVALVEAIAAEPAFFRGRPHPIFGALSEAAWRRWAYLHLDHHLRQFGA